MLKSALALMFAVSITYMSPHIYGEYDRLGGSKLTTHSAAVADTTETPKGAQVGDPAPALEVTTWLNHPEWLKAPAPAPMTFGDGHVYVLDFTAWWCGACPDNYPPLTEISKQYSSQGVRVILVTAFDSQDLEYLKQDFQKSQNQERSMFGMAPPPPVTLPIIVDGLPKDSVTSFNSTNVRRYGADTMPMVVVVDQHGVIKFRKVGLVQEDNLPALLDSLLKSPTTKP